MNSTPQKVGTTAVAVCLLTISLTAQESAQVPQHAFRSSVDVVTIQASVRDARGRIVS